MPTVHSFDSILPPPRFDSIPWTGVLAEEKPVTGGDWAEIDDQAVTPDPTPDTPTAVSISVLASAPEALFRFRFRDGDGNVSPYTEPILSPLGQDSFGYRPTVAQISALLRARIIDADGNRYPEFNNDTVVTADDVERLIDQALLEVPSQLGDVEAANYTQTAAWVAYRAAMLVEATFWPEDTGADESNYARYDRLSGTLGLSLVSAENDNTPGRPRFGSIPISTVTAESSLYYDVDGLLP